MSSPIGPPSDSQRLTSGRHEPRRYVPPDRSTVVLTLTGSEIELLRDAVSWWLANWLTRVPVDLHDEQRAPFDQMTDIGRRLGLNL